jgi:hypothetical protein
LERSLVRKEAVGEKLGRGVIREKLLCEEDVAEEVARKVAGEELFILMLMREREVEER